MSKGDKDIVKTLLENIKQNISKEEALTYSIVYKIMLLSKILSLEIEREDFKLGNIRLLNRIRASHNHLEKLPKEITSTIGIDFKEIFPEYNEEKMYLLMDLFYNSLFQTQEDLEKVVGSSNFILNQKQNKK